MLVVTRRVSFIWSMALHKGSSVFRSRYALHRHPSKSNANFTSPLEDYVSGEGGVLGRLSDSDINAACQISLLKKLHFRAESSRILMEN